jgi:hypothetical protein
LLAIPYFLNLRYFPNLLRALANILPVRGDESLKKPGTPTINIAMPVHGSTVSKNARKYGEINLINPRLMSILILIQVLIVL